MDLDPDTFLTTVYCVIDDWYQANQATALAHRPGARGKLSDSEMLTLAILTQWQAHRCERCLLRYARTHWQAYFPVLPSQSACNRRVRTLWALLVELGPALAAAVQSLLGQQPAYEVWDGVPVPLARRCRGRRRRLFTAGEADLGQGGSDKDWYYGVKALVTISQHGPITGWTVGPANLAEYWLAEALLRWRAAPDAPAPRPDELAAVLGPSHKRGGGRAGPQGRLGPRPAVGRSADVPIIGDLGFQGRDWRAHWRTDYGATVLTKAEYAQVANLTEQAHWRRWLSGLRQQVEATFNVLNDLLGLAFPRVRDVWGLWTRLAAKVAAFNLLLYLNTLFDRPLHAFAYPMT